MEHALPVGTELRSSTNTYIIRSVLGSGGFGITYKATFNLVVNGLPIQAVVAIKEHFISADCERNQLTREVCYSAPVKSRVEGSRKDFVGEARRLQAVGRGHRNIVQVSEVFDANNTSYYVMEYLEGESLSDYVRSREPLSESETLSIMMPIIEAVGYLHQNRITHLDIKPANIMLAKDHNGDVRPVLIDFGLSKHYNEDGSATSTINTRGFSDGYAPVEQYVGISTFSPASDVYSLAATIMYCLTGRSLPKSIELTPQAVGTSIPVEISPTLRKILLESLQMLAPQRPTDGNELYEMLGGIRSMGRTTILIHDDDKTKIFSRDGIEEDKTEFISSSSLELTFNIKGVSFEMVRVDGGFFMMGSDDSDAENYEKPVHSETIETFYIGRTEVTQSLWAAVMGNNPSYDIGANRPVHNVSWNDCKEFIGRLNRLTGKKFRLPSEAEWEYAARGGNRSKGYKYSGSNDLDRVGWYYINSGFKLHPVATKLDNELGLYDMSGNVWEWTSDKWSDNYNSPRNNSNRVFRGGSCLSNATCCRSAVRCNYTPDYRDGDIGFRLAL